MKKTFVILALSSVIAACGGNAKMDENDSTTAADHTELPITDTVIGGGDSIVATPSPAVVEKKLDTVVAATTNPEQKKEEKPAPKQETAAVGSAKGAALIKGADCVACHKDDTKLVGPAYVDVAKKYKPTAANISMLAHKVIKGGAGNWGDIPMTPHPGVSESDAKEMVKHILSLK